MGNYPDDNPIVDFTRVLQNEAGEWYFLGYSSNGNVIVRSSEGYENEGWARQVAAELAPIKDDGWDDVGAAPIDVGSD